MQVARRVLQHGVKVLNPRQAADVDLKLILIAVNARHGAGGDVIGQVALRLLLLSLILILIFIVRRGRRVIVIRRRFVFEAVLIELFVQTRNRTTDRQPGGVGKIDRVEGDRAAQVVGDDLQHRPGKLRLFDAAAAGVERPQMQLNRPPDRPQHDHRQGERQDKLQERDGAAGDGGAEIHNYGRRPSSRPSPTGRGGIRVIALG